MKVVIGTRTWLGSDWTHVDIDERPLKDPATGKAYPVDVVCDARAVLLPDQCAEEVYSQECLEHFPYKEYQAVLEEWCRLVAPGGKIVIEVPDFLAACNQALQIDTLEMDRGINQIIYGGQYSKWDFHYVGLTPRMFEDDFARMGFNIDKIERGWEVGYLRVTASRPE